MDYEIETKEFEKILLSMQHITQTIKRGEKNVAILEYDPEQFFTKITNPVLGKEKTKYAIRTEGFEMLLSVMLNVTQKIKKGEKCVAKINYNPDALSTKIEIVKEWSGMEAVPEREPERNNKRFCGNGGQAVG